MTVTAVLTFSGLQWLWPAAALVVATAALLAWSYAAAPTRTLRWLGPALKLAGLAALLLCLLEPLWLGQRAKPGANLLAIVADNSAGLQVHDRGDAHSRGENLRALLQPETAGWQAGLEGTFEMKRYLFDARLQPTADFHELTFDGRSTALASALQLLRDRLQGRPVAGVLLLTDGNATDLPSGNLPNLAGLPPVYPVVIGRPEPLHDIAIQQVRTAQSSFEDAPVAVQADVSAAGYRGAKLVGQLVDRSGRVLQEQTVEAAGASEVVPLRFQLKPDAAGLSFYQVEVRSRAESGSPQTEEATLANNRSVVTVDRGRGPFRVLYVSGRPNWEFKFLSRALQPDHQLELAALIRVARREPKFDFRGHAGETSNPLFRGFGSQAPEEVQAYDQPVLVRLNTRDENELRAGFPRTAEELYRFDAVIVQDVEAEFFAPEQAMLLQKFVSERGGGLLMLGGMESFAEGKYLRTPVGDMLPVYLEPADPAPDAPAGDVRLQLTREGWLQPWARLRDNEGAEKTRLDAMPPFAVFNRVRGIKPGASVLATAKDSRGGEFPALVAQRFGRGRSAAVMIGDLWRWGMRDPAAHADLEKSWRQLVRWLVSDVPGRVQCTAEPVEASEAVRLTVLVRDEKFQPVDDAAVSIEVEPVAFGGEPSAPKLKLEAEPGTSEPGRYEALYVPRQTGGYRARVTVKGRNGADLGHAEAGWTSDLAGQEFRSLTPNVALLEEIARRTGGRVVQSGELRRFARELPSRAAPVMETWTRPAWHTPALFGFALLCFVLEWGLRRRKGLA